MKLISVAFDKSPLGLRPLISYLEIGKTKPYEDWRVVVKGPSVMLISPPGWRLGSGRPEGKLVRAWEIPRTECQLQWEAEESELVDEKTKR